MKKFLEPEMQIRRFDLEDILTASSTEQPSASEDEPIPTVDEDEGVIV